MEYQWIINDMSDLYLNEDQNNTICLCPKPKEKLIYPDKVDIMKDAENTQ